MFGIGLRKHHQLDIAGIALENLIVFHQIIDFIRRECQAQFAVGLHQSFFARAQHVYRVEGLRLRMGKQRRGRLKIGQHAFGHAVVQKRCPLLLLRFGECTFNPHRHTALDALDVIQAAIAGDVGGFRGPRRNGADARGNQK